MTRQLAALIFLASATLAVRAQHPAFEVASIKRNNSGAEGARVSGNLGRLTITNNPLRNIIRNAWGLQGFQIVGGPDWINTERWDIVAKVEAGAERQNVMPMVQNLLADRFKLKVHKETRELPIFALTFARADHAFGPKLHASSTDCAKEVSAAIDRSGRPPGPDSPLLCGGRFFPGHIEMNAESINNFIRNLAPVVGRSIVDKTGLAGGFDAALTWNDGEDMVPLYSRRYRNSSGLN